MSVLDKRVLQLTELFDSFLTISNAHTVGSGVDAVCPGIFVGTRDFANDGRNLKKLRITHVLNVCNDLKRTDRDKFSDVVFVHVSFENAKRRKKDCSSLFRLTSAFVRRALSAGGKVLVYSLLGVNQAPAVVIAYFVETYRVSVERASLVIAMKRLVKPNDFLLQQLIRLSDDVLNSGGKSTDGETTRCVVDADADRLRNAMNLVNGVEARRRRVRSVDGARMVVYNLFVGTDGVATDVVRIAKNHISHLLDLRGTDYEDVKYREPGMKLTSAGPLQNVSFDLESLVEICVSFIADCLKRGERLLVLGRECECLADTAIAAYVMESHDATVEEALSVTTDRRSVYLGVDYLEFLFSYERRLCQRKRNILRRKLEEAFYFPNCDIKLKRVNDLSFLRISKETSV